MQNKVFSLWKWTCEEAKLWITFLAHVWEHAYTILCTVHLFYVCICGKEGLATNLFAMLFFFLLNWHNVKEMPLIRCINKTIYKCVRKIECIMNSLKFSAMLEESGAGAS